MDKVVIEGIPGYSGEYEFDTSRVLTHGEMHIVKRIAGVRAGEVDDAIAAGDTDMVIALAVIALKRSGKQVVEDMLWDAPTGSITYVGEGDDADPPAEAPSSDGVTSSAPADASENTSAS